MPRVKALKHKYVGKVVKHWMIDADVKGEEVANALGISRGHFYYKVNNNSFTYEDLLDIIEVCDVSDEEIVRAMRR